MRTYALVVGINRYPRFAEPPPLNGAVADACDFADWALDPDGGGVARKDLLFWAHPWPEAAQPGGHDHIRPFLRGYLEDVSPDGPPVWDNILLGPAPADQGRPPVASEIVTTIEAVGRKHYVAKEFGGEAEASRVLVFLAGHGVRGTPVGALTEETCFVAHDFRSSGSDMATGLVACESLKRSLLSKRFDEALFFLDCCRVQTSKLDVQVSPLADPAGEGPSPWTLALAAQDYMPAYETTGAPIRGAFSSALMDGLRTCREVPGAHLSSGRLRTFVRDSIKNYTESGQNPRIEFRPDDDVGPIIVAGGGVAAAAPAPVPLFPSPTVALDGLSPGTMLTLKNGPLPVPGVGLIEAGPAPVALPQLAEGLYSLEVVGDSSTYTLFRIPGKDRIDVR